MLYNIILRLGKMRYYDIAEELNIKISVVKKYRKEIFKRLDKEKKQSILQQEQKIEELREKILAGEMKKRPRNHSFGVEGLVRGIIRYTSTISYHRKRIKENIKRKYPPRIMNMVPNKSMKIKKLLKMHKRQKDICSILDISSATASTIIKKMRYKSDIR